MVGIAIQKYPNNAFAGKFAVVGTYDGRCIFYSTDQLKYHTTIHVRFVMKTCSYHGLQLMTSYFQVSQRKEFKGS